MQAPSNAEIRQAIAIIDFGAEATEEEYVQAYRTLRDAGYIPMLPPKYAAGLATFTKAGVIQSNELPPHKTITEAKP